MRMTIRPSLCAMLANANGLNVFMEDKLIATQEVADAREQLSAAIHSGQQLLAFMDDLDTAKGSLEGLGFSDEWLESINKDNKFLDAINVDLVNLVGSNAEKADACMEGLVDSIWGIVQRIWQWIVGAIKKLVMYFKRVMLVYKMKGLEDDKRRAFFLALLNRDDIPDVLRQLGEAINKVGGRGGKAYDIRQLIERASVARVITSYFLNSIVPVYGFNKQGLDKETVTDKDIVSDRLVHLAASGKDVYDPIMTQFKYDIDNDQTKICTVACTSTEGFKGGFSMMQTPEPFGQMMRNAGYRIKDGVGGVSAFSFEPLEGCIDSIDYAKVFTTAEQYNQVFGGGYDTAVRYTGIVNRAVGDYMNYLTVASECIDLVIGDLRTVALSAANGPKGVLPKVKHVVVPYNPALGRALQLQAKFIAETISIVMKFSTEMINTLGMAQKLYACVDQMKDKLL